MKKSLPSKLTNEKIYQSLILAFTSAPIGLFSNNISKIWNSDIMTCGTYEEKRHAIDCIKRLCCQNNFVIDAAKTLYVPEFPQQIKKDIQEFTKQLLPHFFVFAKDKIKEQVREPNNTIVNKLFKHIPNPRLKFSYMNSEGKRKALGKPNYCLLMTNPDLELKIDKDRINNPIIKKYSELASKYGYKISVVSNDSEIGQFPREVLYKSQLKERALYGKIYKQVRDEMANNGYEDWEVADILVKYLYDIKNSKNKDLLWICYGEYLYRNLEKNVKPPTKEVQCVDCGEWFEILKKDNETCRCANCYREYRRKYKTQKERERRMRMKLKGDMDSTKKS